MNDNTADFAGQVDSLVAAITTVKQLIAAGLLDAAALGLSQTEAAEAPASRDALVPGTPITVRALVAKARPGLKASTHRTYNSYMKLLAEGYTDPVDPSLTHPGFGDKLAHEVLPTDLEQLLAFVKQRALVHAGRRAANREAVGRAVRDHDGEGARYSAVGAWRYVFEVAVKDRHLARQFNPAQDIKKPKRSTGSRRPLKDSQMNDFWSVVRGTGNDSELDWMICQTILITGARREGLLNLTLGWIYQDQGTVKLHEKGDKKVDQPVPDWFLEMLLEFATARGASRPGDKVFRLLPKPDGTPGDPITSRRLDGLFQRVQSLLAWADREQVTAHTLRHHAVGMVERHAGRQVAMAFARHEPEDTTGLYGRASREEVARAVIDIHGGEHPWVSDAD